jgi:hypothetical protein
MDWIGWIGWEEGWMDKGFYKKRRRGNMNIYLSYIYHHHMEQTKFIVSRKLWIGVVWIGVDSGLE